MKNTKHNLDFLTLLSSFLLHLRLRNNHLQWYSVPRSSSVSADKTARLRKPEADSVSQPRRSLTDLRAANKCVQEGTRLPVISLSSPWKGMVSKYCRFILQEFKACSAWGLRRRSVSVTEVQVVPVLSKVC